MDVRFINPVLDAMSNVLSTMAQMDIQVGKPCIKADTYALGPVSSMMDMVSSKARGSLAITFTESVIQDLGRRMLEEEIHGTSDMAENLAGEITNMVVGGAKSSLEQLGYDFDMSIPEVMSGEQYLIEHKYGEQTILLPFSVISGDFFVELCFENV